MSSEGLSVAVRPWPLIRWATWAWPKVSLPDYPRDRRTICYHEAAHAVVALLFDLPIGSAHIFDDAGGLHGKVEITPRPPRDTAAPIPRAVLEAAGVRLAAMYLSGTIAELLLHGFEASGWLGLDTRDWRHARTVLKEAFGHDLPLFYCQCVAAAVLSANWDWVRAVAEALDEAGTLSVQTVQRLCPAASPDC